MARTFRKVAKIKTVSCALGKQFLTDLIFVVLLDKTSK